jgi:SAM-dependent methyltransferase
MTTPAHPPLRTRAQIIDYLQSFDLFKGNEFEGYAYIRDAIGRFLITVQLVPPAPEPGASLLELGANPYFITLLLQHFHSYQLSLANYFGPAEPRSAAEQTIHSARFGETHTFRYAHFNVEHDPFPYPDNSFAGVLFCEILEHLTIDPTHTLTEIHRVLKPGGFVLVTTPNLTRWEHVRDLVLGKTINDPYSGYGVYGRHNREYTAAEVGRLLSDCGFTVDQVRLANIHKRDAEQYVISALRPVWSEHLFALAYANQPRRHRYAPWLYRSMHTLRRVISNRIMVGYNDELHFGAGWFPLDEPGNGYEPVRWTQQRAEVFLRAAGGEDTLTLELNSGPAALGTVQVTLRCADASTQMSPPAASWVPLVLQLPPQQAGDEVAVTIEVDQLRCPAEQGLSPDPRQLGVLVRMLALQRPTASMTMGDNDLPPQLGAGWYERETHARTPLRWTQQCAEVFLQAAGGEERLVLELNSGPTALGDVQVRLRCGDHSSSATPASDSWSTLVLPLPACAPAAELTVTIEVDQLRWPAARGLGDDQRGLGVMVSSVRLE